MDGLRPLHGLIELHYMRRTRTPVTPREDAVAKLQLEIHGALKLTGNPSAHRSAPAVEALCMSSDTMRRELLNSTDRDSFAFLHLSSSRGTASRQRHICIADDQFSALFVLVFDSILYLCCDASRFMSTHVLWLKRCVVRHPPNVMAVSGRGGNH